MPEFRLAQISDTHLTRRHQSLTDNFHRVSEYIDATRPDLVVNSGDLAWDAPTSPDDFEFSRELHDALAAPCRYLPGNHDIGDNPTELGRFRLSPSPSKACRLSARASAVIAGASKPPAGASSASIQW